MYKFIYDGKIVDIVENIRYLRYLKQSKHVVGCDASSANCVQASDGIGIYGIQGAKLPEYLDYKKVIIKPITIEEYNKLKALLKQNNIINADSFELYEARNKKIIELENECKDVIIKGITIKLSDENYHSFELTIEDQVNLNVIHTKLLQGISSCIYHEKGKICKRFSKEDLLKIIQASNYHIEYNTTYFNLMKNCIYNMYNIDQIKAIHYGDLIPNSEYQDILNQL